MVSRLRRFVQTRYASERALVRLWLAHLESWGGRTREFERVDLSRVERLVFVCLGNICRSPFAERIARQYNVPTAGFGLSTTTGQPAFPLARETAPHFGIDLGPHRTKDFSDFELYSSDLLLAMEVRHARRLRRLIGASPVQIALLGHWARPRRLHIHDPHAHDAIYFNHCYRIIDQATRNLVEEYRQARGLPTH